MDFCSHVAGGTAASSWRKWMRAVAGHLGHFLGRPPERGACFDPRLQFTSYTEATTVKAVATEPLRTVDRTATTRACVSGTNRDC